MECVRARHDPNRSLMSRRASREFIPEARGLTPRRMQAHRSTSGDSSSPPLRPSAPSRCGSAYLLPRLSALGCLTSLACAGPMMPSADFCMLVRLGLLLAQSPALANRMQSSQGKTRRTFCA